jgi:glycosyltransferase involved in cell wall biosynthesis
MSGVPPGPPRVLSLVWNLMRGGTEGQCARVAMGLAARGRTHRLAVFRREGFFLEAVEAGCGSVLTFDLRGRFHWTAWTAPRALARLLREARIDLLHAWDMDACLFGAAAAAQAGLPLVTSRRDLGQIYPAWKLRRLAAVERRAAAVVVNAEAVAEVARAAGVPAARLRLLPNLLDLEEFDRLAADPPPPGWPAPRPGITRLVLVARLDPEKDAGFLLQAVRVLSARRNDFEVLLAGDGSERPALEEAARGLEGIVHFLGEVRAVPALLRTAQIGVLVPRANEGLSNTLLEYMAAGLPSVVTDCGGNRECVAEGETGFRVRSGDVAALAAALERLLEDAPRRAAFGAEARRRVAARHGREAVLDRFDAFYTEVVRGLA